MPTTKSLEEAEQLLKTDALRMDHYELPLSEVHLVAPDEVKIGEDKFTLTNFGQRSLCKVLEMPNNFSTRLHADATDLWKDMVVKLETLRDTSVRVSTSISDRGTQVIDGINKSSVGWINNEEFFKLAKFWLDYKPVKLSLKGINIDSTGGMIIQLRFPESEVSLISDKSDLFTLGLTLSNSEVVRWRTEAALDLERMVCTNRARISEKSYVMCQSHVKGSGRLIENLWSDTQQIVQMNVSVAEFLKTRINRLVDVPASLRELEMAYRTATKNIMNCEMVVPDLDKRIPFKSVLAKYGIEAKEKTERWKSTATTPVSCYKLYNELTYLGSNLEHLPETQLAMEIECGKTFLSEHGPDLSDIAPRMSWN